MHFRRMVYLSDLAPDWPGLDTDPRALVRQSSKWDYAYE